MQATFPQLIADHEQIDEEAKRLLAMLGDGGDPSALAGQLAALSFAVAGHLAVEDEIVAACDAKVLAEPWRKVWEQGRAAFDKLRADWIEFIGWWHVEAIRSDRDGFHAEAEDVLGRLRERMDQETQAFYAAALQFGIIRLR